MHQVKKLCEPDVIDLSAKKTETPASSAATSVSDVSLSAARSDTAATPASAPAAAAVADKPTTDTSVSSAAAAYPDANRQSCTVAPSGSSPRM